MTGTAGRPRPRVRRTRMFATCVPGLSRMLRRQLEQDDGIECTGTGFDGRADIVFFEADRAGRETAMASRLAEDVFAETGRASRTGASGPGAVAALAWPPDGVQRALSVWADEVRPLSGSMSFRVITRVLGESRFLRTDLRQAMTAAIGRDKPRWRTADPARLEIWISEWHDGQYVAGLRLSGTRMRQHGGRSAERHGALRPTVAAAMVQLAGPPGRSGQPGEVLLDPCCGSGTILAEALAAGWTAEGSDIDAEAVEAASGNAPRATVQLGDARELLLPDDSVGACVSNLPFGRQFTVQGDQADWTAGVLGEMSRVTRSGGSVVLLSPDLPRAAIPAALRLRKQVPLRLLGTAPSIWLFHRA
jgi:23S rRNA G2445 N2-methylase RlmL